MTFGFILCAVPLLAILVIYFGSRLEKLSGWKPLESAKVCYCQYWKRVLVLVNF